MCEHVPFENETRWVLQAADQTDLDRRAEATGIAQDALMESAARNAANWLLEHTRPHRVVALAGPGGNGGDALAVARHLHEASVEVRTFLVPPHNKLAPATRRMVDRLRATGLELYEMDDLAFALTDADCAIDGLLGSGMSRPLEGRYLEAVERLNATAAPTVSLDLPSGLASDRGALLGDAVRADITLAMAFLKPAHLLYPAAAYCGNVAVVGVDYPESVLSDAALWARVCESVDIRRRLPERPAVGHKGTFGRVLVVAGSEGMTGAAMLCCRAAFRAGAGLVTLAAPAAVVPILETALPETITIPLPEDIDFDEPRLREAIARSDVLAIGPGVTRVPSMIERMRAFVERFDGPVVIDADGLYALIGQDDVWTALAGRAVLTPHPREFSALTGDSIDPVEANRRDAVQRFAEQRGCVVVLKGRPTAIGLPDGAVYLNPTGNEGLGTGGTGDVLCGLIAGFAAGGISLADAAIAGTYVHGLAAEIYGRDRATRSLMSSDLIDMLPIALQEVELCG